MPEQSEFAIQLAEGIRQIDKVEWNRLADPSGNPFLSHEFLSSLEESGCLGGRTGWMPNFLQLREKGGGNRLVAAAPAYLKSHSQGEYVFDHGWADAFERAGGKYYPKLQVAVPFTPVPGPRLLAENDTARTELAGILARITAGNQLSSLHVTFCTEEDARIMSAAGYLIRNDRQFHWFNKGYGSYDDFLAELASRKRKALKKERREALAKDISIEWVTGQDLTEAHFDAFFEFYMDTGNRKWGRPYLNRQFFTLIHERMADRILLVMAKRDGRYIAGAINFIGTDTLYGRNWGCIEDHPCLHFEVCYHQAIDFAISRGLARVEAGAQGEHKLARGYLPALTYSAHFLPDPSFRRAVARFLEQERQMVESESEVLTELGPFRRGPLQQADEAD